MSRSSFLLFSFTVAILAAAASLQSSGGERMGNNSASLRYEANADIGALKDDLSGLRGQAVRTPNRLRNLLDDAARNLRALEADATVDAHTAAHRLATFVRIS